MSSTEQRSLKSEFPGHFRDGDEIIDAAWKTHTFVFDTNILLNFFRYSEATRRDFEAVLKNIKDRVWIPHRVAQEYFSRRATVISGEIGQYDKAKTTISELINSLEANRQHPHVSPDTLTKVKKILGELTAELDSNSNVLADSLQIDSVSEFFNAIFSGKIGIKLTREEELALMDEGAKRFEEKIPPAFNDAHKAKDAKTHEEKLAPFGDLIIWKAITEYAKRDSQGIIFITDDNKSDWWSIAHGRTLGPRPELVKEFKESTSKSIYFYNAHRFLEYSRSSLSQKISDASVIEVKEIGETNVESVSFHKKIAKTRYDLIKSGLLDEYFRLIKFKASELERIARDVYHNDTEKKSIEEEMVDNSDLHREIILKAKLMKVNLNKNNLENRYRKTQEEIASINERIAELEASSTDD